MQLKRTKEIMYYVAVFPLEAVSSFFEGINLQKVSLVNFLRELSLQSGAAVSARCVGFYSLYICIVDR